MQPMIHRRKAAVRRSHLKRFMSDTIHIKQGPLRSAELGVDRNGAELRHKFDAFALKSRNKAAQETFGSTAHHDLFDSTRLRTPWQGVLRRQGVEDVHAIVLEKGRYNVILYYFVGLDHWLVEAKQLANVIRRSIVYSTRERMLEAHREDCITWEETQKLVPSASGE